MEKDLQAAQASGNIGALLGLLTTSSRLPDQDFIEKTIGSLRFLYYMYMEKLHNRPIDLNDLVDGLLYIEGVSYIQETERMKMERNR